MDRIVTNCLDKGFSRYQKEFEEAAIRVLRSGWYIMGKELESFEAKFAEYCGAEFCLGTASGLDALILACKAIDLKPGDEVIVQANTYIATVMSITTVGATPVLVEPDENYLIDPENIRKKITDKTKAIMVVHLYGQATDMDTIMKLCEEYHLRLIEDCAQSHGAKWNGKMTGTFGDVGCFSFYPTKNLGAFGDGGAIVTDDEAIRDRIKMLRNYGSKVRYYNEEVGMNSRLDEIQAALLSVRLSHLPELTEERIQIAGRYLAGIKNPKIILPQRKEGADHVYHQFVIRCKERKELMEYLDKKDIGTIIHYPVPPHLAKAYESLGYQKGDFPITEMYADEVLSIPMYNGLTEEDQTRVIEALNQF